MDEVTPLEILIVGAGMYTGGRGTDGFGTLLPAVTEWTRGGRRGRVLAVGTSPESAADLLDRAARLGRATGRPLEIEALPSGKASRAAYRDAIARLRQPACAIVAVPDHLHHEIASATIRAGLHTLVVKPLTPTLDEALDLVEQAEAASVYGAVELHKRFDRSNLLLREAVRSGRIGDPLCFLIQYGQRRSVPLEHFWTWAARTNVFQYLGVHYVDVIHFATGARPVTAVAVGQKHLLASHGIDTFDAIEAVVEWRRPDGHEFASVFVTNWVEPVSSSAMSDQRISVVGTAGRYEADQKRRGITTVSDDRGVEEPNPDFCASYTDAAGALRHVGYGIESVTTFLDDVVRLHAGELTLRDLEGERPTFQSALASVAAVEAVNASLGTPGARVPVRAWDGIGRAERG